MSAVRQIGIKMTVDAQSVTTELPKAAREFDNLGNRAEQASSRSTRSLAQVSMSVRDIVQGAAGLHIVGSAIETISNALTSLPQNAFDFSKNLEVSQVGMAGILGSMTAINGQQLDYNTALKLSSEYIRKLNDDALRTAATSQELTQVFQALLAPGLGAKMTLEEIRQLTVVGTNAVKSMGLDAGQVVQELRDLVAGGIQPASSTLATALGLKDSDIAKAKASSEGLFAFLMERMKGFDASSEAFGNTFKGKLDQLKEGATRVAAEGMEPLITASKVAVSELANLFVTIDEGGKVSLNQELVSTIREYAEGAVLALQAGKDFISVLWENRDAAVALAAVWAAYKIGNVVSETVAAVAAKAELAQASRLAAVQAAAESASNAEVVVSSRAKVAAYLAELQAKVASAEADAAAQVAELARLATTQEAIVLARADVAAKLDSVRATIAQTEAQIAAARAAGAQSIALALVREGTQALTLAQAQHAALLNELALLGKQQAGVQAAMATATAAHTTSVNAASAAAGTLAAAQGAASIAGRALSGVMGFLGGPIGLVTTALTLGVTAWTIWGSSGANAEAKVQGAVAESTPEIIADLDKQIDKLKQRNALAAAGLEDIAKLNTKDAERVAELHGQIADLQAGKGINGGAPLPEVARVELLQKSLVEYGTLIGKIRGASAEQAKLDASTSKLTLTVTGAEQAWRKTIDGVKTATSIQQDYSDKLKASQDAFAAFKKTAQESPNFDPEKLRLAQKEQDQAEKALADERDRKIKEMGAGAASAQSHAIDAQVEAIKQGYKVMAAQTAESLREVDSAKKQGLLSDSEALEQRTALQLADVDAQRKSVESEIALIKGRKDSAKQQATLVGELAELQQKRLSIESDAQRQQREIDAQVADELERRVQTAQTAAAASRESVRVAKLDTEEIGKTGAALGALRLARVEDTASALERQAVTMDGIDLSGRASAALRQQAKDTRELAAVQGYNDSARKVYEYAKAIDEANAATQFELNLGAVSQREREIALEQYRIAIQLKQLLAEIDAANPADQAGAEKLKADAIAAAACAQSSASSRVTLREWSRTVDQIDDVFRQGFADMLNRGEDGWKAFTKSLATTFKTTVANELYKAFAQRFVVNIVGNVVGLIGGDSGGVSSALGGSGGGIMGMASNLSSLYSTGSRIMGLFGGGSAAAGAAASGLGFTATSAGASAIGAGIGSSLGAGMGAAASTVGGVGMTVGGGTLGMTATSAGASAIGAGIGTGAATAGTAAAGTAAAGTGGLMSALSAIPVWGWIAAAVVAAIGFIVGNDDSGTPHVGSVGSYSEEEGYRQAQDGTELGIDMGMRYGGTEMAKIPETVSKGVVGVLDGLADVFDKDSGYKVVTGFADDGSKDGAWGGLRIIGADGKDLVNWDDTRTSKWAPRTFANGEEGLKEYLSAVAVDTRKVMLESLDLPSWAKDIVGSVSEEDFNLDTLQAVVTQIGQVQAVFDDLGKTIKGLGNLSSEAMGKLSEASGGLEQLSANANAYYQNFYSEEDRVAKKRELINESLKDLGLDEIDLAADNARESFRQLVEQQLALGDTSTTTVAALLGLSESIASVTSSADEAAKAEKEAAERKAQEAKDRRRDAIDQAWDVLERSVAAAREAAQAQVDLYEAQAAAARSVVELTRSQVRELRGLVQSTAQMSVRDAESFIERALAAARSTGHLPDASELSQAISIARSSMGTDAYSNRLDYEAAQLILANKLEAIGDVSDAQLTTDELLLEQARAEVDRLDQLLATEKQALDAANGINTSVKDVATAVRDFRAALLNESGDGGTEGVTSGTGGSSGGPVVGPSGGSTSSGTRAKYYKTVETGTGTFEMGVTDAATVSRLDGLKSFWDSAPANGYTDITDVYKDLAKAGYSSNEIAAATGLNYDDLKDSIARHGVPAFATGGYHLGGVRLVGEDGPEMEFTGPSRILNARLTEDLLNGSGNMDIAELLKAIQRLGDQDYAIGRRVIELLMSLDSVSRKTDLVGMKQRVEASV